MAHIWNPIKRYRVQKNLSQKDVADLCGYKSAQYISNIERDMCYLSADSFWLMHDAIGLPLQVYIEYRQKIFEKTLRSRLNKLKEKHYGRIKKR